MTNRTYLSDTKKKKRGKEEPKGIILFVRMKLKISKEEISQQKSKSPNEEGTETE